MTKKHGMAREEVDRMTNSRRRYNPQDAAGDAADTAASEASTSVPAGLGAPGAVAFSARNTQGRSSAADDASLHPFS